MSDFHNMDRMMSEFRSSFGMPQMMIGGSRLPNRRSNELTPFGGNMFSGNMFGNMQTMMSEMSNNPSAHSFSSSRVISYSSNGNGQPKYYEAASETTQGPNGVRQTRRCERNSQTGLNKLAIGHHIYDRGHVVERSVNRRTNEREEKHDYLNMDEDEKDSFHQEWRSKARPTMHHAGADRIHHNRREPRALNSSEYHRQNLERSRRHKERQNNDENPRHSDVRFNSRLDEI